MEPPKKISRQRSTPTQIKMLVDFMAQNTRFANGEYGGPLGARGQEEMWRTLAALLAEYGPSKDVEQWKTTWRDLKKNARRDNAAYNRGYNETGNPQKELVAVKEQRLKILSIIGMEMSVGLGPKESAIDHGQLPIPAIRNPRTTTAALQTPSTSTAASPIRSIFTTAPSTSNAAPPTSHASPPTCHASPPVPLTPPVSNSNTTPPVSSTSNAAPLVPAIPNTSANARQKSRKRQSSTNNEGRFLALQEENNALLNGILQALNEIAAILRERNTVLSRNQPQGPQE